VLKAAAYVRALTLEQTRNGLSPSEQRGRIEAHIAEHGWQLAGVYEDLGPGARANRMPGLDAIFENAAALDRLVVVSLDRLGPPRRLLAAVTRLREAGCELVSLEEGFDTGEASGQAVPALLETLRERGPRPWAPSSNWSAAHLGSLGFRPGTVIDVGAADGTSALYRAFPDAHHVLIEPLHEFEPDLRRNAEEHGGEIVLSAVGSTEGTLTLNVEPRLLMTSALQPVQPALATSERAVPLTTLDKLLDDRAWTPPFGLKIDVEGYEHEVIDGATRLLEEAEFVLCEVSVTGRFEGGLSSAELIERFRSHGFRVGEIIDAASSPLGLHVDVLFRR
jgi:FkbM family methyltransferase